MAMVISADKVGADGIERKADVDLGALEGPRSPRLGQEGWLAPASSMRIASTRAATRAFSSSVSPGKRDEGAGRLVAGDLRRQRLDASRRLDPVGQHDHFVWLSAPDRWDKASLFAGTGIMSITTLQVDIEVDLTLASLVC